MVTRFSGRLPISTTEKSVEALVLVVKCLSIAGQFLWNSLLLVRSSRSKIDLKGESGYQEVVTNLCTEKNNEISKKIWSFVGNDPGNDHVLCNYVIG